MVLRAIRCFREQTYQAKRLLIYDNSSESDPDLDYPRDIDVAYHERAGRSIGLLRNGANGHSEEQIIVHWDSDDWSHPRRIEEQVALLQACGKQCVGYRDMLFWLSPGPGQAWLYSNPDPRYCLGTSLCYWRSAWEERPFPDEPKRKGGSGEDVLWLREINSFGCGSFGPAMQRPPEIMPRMIASIHGHNTQDYSITERSESWKRVPAWDEHCRRVMS